MGRSRDRNNQQRRPEHVAREWERRGETCSVRHSSDRGRGRNIGGASGVRRRRSISSGSSSRSTSSISSLSKTVSSGSDRGTGGDRRAGTKNRADSTVRYSRSRSRERNHGIKARHRGSGVGPRNKRDGEKHQPTNSLVQQRNGDGSAARFDPSRRCSPYRQDSRGDHRLAKKDVHRGEGSSYRARRGDRNSMSQKRSNSPDRRGSSLQSGERPSSNSSSDNRRVAREVKPSSSRLPHPPPEERDANDKDRRISSQRPQERASSNGDACRQSYAQGSSSSSQRRSSLSRDRGGGGKDHRESSIKPREHASPNSGGGSRNCAKKGSVSPLPKRSSSSQDHDIRHREHQKQRLGLRSVRLHRSLVLSSTKAALPVDDHVILRARYRLQPYDISLPYQTSNSTEASFYSEIQCVRSIIQDTAVFDLNFEIELTNMIRPLEQRIRLCLAYRLHGIPPRLRPTMRSFALQVVHRASPHISAHFMKTSMLFSIIHLQYLPTYLPTNSETHSYH